MNFRVENYRDFDCKLRCDLTDMHVGLPVSFWLTAHLRDDYPVYRTALNYAYQAKFYFEYFNARGIDIVERVECVGFLTKQEYLGYLTQCLYKLDYSPASNTKLASIEQYTHKNLDNLIHATRYSQSRVSAATTKLRVKSLISFIRYLYENIHIGNIVPTPIEARYKDLITRLNNYAKKIKDDNAIVKDAFEQAIPSDVYFMMLEITIPHHSDNPWSKLSRLRNHIIVQLFNETGIRLGALCKLKISDLKTDKQPCIQVSQTSNDITDSRARPATQKTKAHVSPISRELMHSLLLYINTDRRKRPEAVKHDFIFIAEKGKTKGQPIALQTVNYLFKKLSKILNFKVHPHLMRHKFQEFFENAGKKKGLSAERINDLRKFSCGWSETPKMVEHYNQFKNAQLAA